MKRVFLLSMALIMLFSSALSESLDLSKMSLEELTFLNEKVNSEITDRVGAATEESYSGLLISGKNIETGSYVLTSVGSVQISIWISESSYGMGVEPNSIIQCSDGEKVSVYFDEETYVLIDEGTVYIQPATEDWVPKTE